MRRKDRAVDFEKIQTIIAQGHVAHIGMFDDVFPYVVPVNYGYEWQGEQLVLYIHGAMKGKKLSCLQANGHVCVEVDLGATLISAGEQATDYSAAFQSVIGYGNAVILTDPALKAHGLDLLMQHETGRGLADFKALKPQQIRGTSVVQITLKQLTGKAHALPTQA
ncbi:pyridoxamine 5'-phosphate oxidase family protein [Loigolactobacillus bifermentans]|uniref:Pyridoxamine 5'-phosphate oxidase family protein n=1 Tax=Loigolactobacillus bifermentans DSM 20003 TaxID=1423726 RepID=A0A0R1H5J2_9LACO|nr:pyridoxamine 5'-phosphate oxidase family protein [Loigolactobacillus bifermentans]KRK39057.1 hypothetical protein FC07_GL002777 [Loigolactobacillus bifermentans DSM 20003]QGG59055.1 pyridoxamine 5'-phosphate oxidase family protein [Loigolactobacillus bifermentans]